MCRSRGSSRQPNGAWARPMHAGAVRVAAGVQRGATRTALRRGAEAARETDAAGGQAIQGRRRHRRLPVAAQVLPQIVAGQEQNAASADVG